MGKEIACCTNVYIALAMMLVYNRKHFFYYFVAERLHQESWIFLNYDLSTIYYEYECSGGGSCAEKPTVYIIIFSSSFSRMDVLNKIIVKQQSAYIFVVGVVRDFNEKKLKYEYE